MKKCRRCSKPATLHITEIRDQVVHELHLCETCAQEYLNSPQSAEVEDPAEGVMAKISEVIGSGELQALDELTCENCGITFHEFRTQGRLGCPHDYIAFEAELMPLLENIHGETQHIGKIPRRAPDGSRRQYRLIKLRNDLRNAVNDEDYEKAAGLRDDIRNLENELAEENLPSD